MTLRFPLSQRILARIEGDHAALVAALPTLAQLSAWAANYTPDNDGYGTGRAPDGTSRSTDPTSTTEAAALAGCSTAEMERIVEGFLAGCLLLADCHSRLSAYVTPKVVKQGRQSTVDVCPACDREMGPGTTLRILGGLCEADHRSWVREGRPDKPYFIRNRRAEQERRRQQEELAARAARAGKAS